MRAPDVVTTRGMKPGNSMASAVIDRFFLLAARDYRCARVAAREPLTITRRWRRSPRRLSASGAKPD
jgi:hypothetical protein